MNVLREKWVEGDKFQVSVADFHRVYLWVMMKRKLKFNLKLVITYKCEPKQIF